MKYELWATRPDVSTMWSEGFSKLTIENGCHSIKILNNVDGQYDYVITEPSFTYALKNIGECLIKNPERTIRKYYWKKGELLFVSFILGRLVNAPIFIIKILYKIYWKYWMDFQKYIMFPHFSERFLEIEIKNKFPDDFDLITTTPKPFIYMCLNRDIFRYSLNRITKKYKWVNIYSFAEDPLNSRYFADYKNKISNSDSIRIFKEIKENNLKFDKLLKKINKQDQKICRLLREFVYIRTDRVDVMRKSGWYIYPFVTKMVKMISSSFTMKEGSMLSHDEVIGLLNGSIIIQEEELKRRGYKKDTIISYSEKGTEFEYGEKEINSLRFQYLKTNISDTEFKGVVAQKGYAKGLVRVYFQGQTKFLESDRDYVFVSKHTMPRDLPYMKNACAIISDEGGITSHTAIVSRELKIPCIIGTKIATKVLKDGMLVEVDANNGVVKIIK